LLIVTCSILSALRISYNRFVKPRSISRICKRGR